MPASNRRDAGVGGPQPTRRRRGGDGWSPRVDRRHFLLSTAAVAAAAVAWRPATSLAGITAARAITDPPFTLGVGSGDPLPDRVVLWTRLAPDPLEGGGMAPGDVTVDWEVAADEGFARVVRSGSATAPAAFAHSVHVDVDGLEPDTWYWYRFSVPGFSSPVGRTRTTPANGSAVARMAFGFASCQNYGNGYYTSHTHLAAEPLDVCFHLGDYIYESTGSRIRPVPGGEAQDLLGYRNRYALYRSDTELQAAHHAFPWVVTWDDHEVDNNYADLISENNDPIEAFRTRRAEAYQAWWEHQAVRMPPPVGADLPIYRSTPWGQLGTFYALDTRQYRANQGCGDGIVEPCADNDDPTRTMLGDAQEAWLDGAMRSSDTTWNVVAQSVVMGSTPLGPFINQDQWDGYPFARQRMMDLFARPEVRNPLVLSGDIHASGAGHLLADWDDPDGSPIIGHEVVGTSISSSFPAELVDIFGDLVSALPWAVYANARHRGYVTVELTPESATTRWRVVDTIDEPTSAVRTDFEWTIDAVAAGEPASPGSGPSSAPAGPTGPSPSGAQRPAPAQPVRTQPRFTG
ncbi:MAG: alkaline phosphatase D family protein [Acidimicrobiia bacterium]|nr:alkaline phosphatase D family protein [Acidimicrobiia bacterium]